MVQSKRSPRNHLNDLEAKQWMKFKKSFFIHDEVEKEWKVKKAHPATYPATIPEMFIEYFTKAGMTVLDPMCGTGSTLVAAERSGRKGIGIELNPSYAQIARSLTDQEVIVADARDLKEHVSSIDYCIFSPPYHNTLHKSRGGVRTRHKARIEEGLDEVYSGSESDLGNLDDEEVFLSGLEQITDQVYDLLPEGRFMTIVIQNEVNLYFNPIAWKIGLRLAEKWHLKPERIWCQQTKPLTIHGWPKTFVTNNHHHYCLTFQKEGRPKPRKR